MFGIAKPSKRSFFLRLNGSPNFKIAHPDEGISFELAWIGDISLYSIFKVNFQDTEYLGYFPSKQMSKTEKTAIPLKSPSNVQFDYGSANNIAEMKEMNVQLYKYDSRDNTASLDKQIQVDTSTLKPGRHYQILATKDSEANDVSIQLIEMGAYTFRSTKEAKEEDEAKKAKETVDTLKSKEAPAEASHVAPTSTTPSGLGGRRN